MTCGQVESRLIIGIGGIGRVAVLSAELVTAGVYNYSVALKLLFIVTIINYMYALQAPV